MCRSLSGRIRRLTQVRLTAGWECPLPPSSTTIENNSRLARQRGIPRPAGLRGDCGGKHPTGCGGSPVPVVPPGLMTSKYPLWRGLWRGASLKRRTETRAVCVRSGTRQEGSRPGRAPNSIIPRESTSVAG